VLGGKGESVRRIFPYVWLSPRGVWALLVLAALIAVASVVSWLMGVVYGAALVFIAAIVVDLRYAPTAATLLVARESIGRLMIGRTAAIAYPIENHGLLPVRIGLIETPLSTISFEREMLTTTLPAGQSTCLEQSVVADRRGKVRFGSLYFWTESGLGLLRRQFAVPADEEVDVFPDLSAVERYGSLTPRKTLLEMGLRKLRLRGVGSEFESLREYAPGDSFRSVDWKATARRGRMIVQQYEAARSAQVIILLDCGRLMTPRMGKQQKFDFALTAGLSVARIAQAADDHVGLTAFAAKPLLSIAPRRGQRHVAALMKAVFDLQPRLEESDYDLAFSALEHRYGKRGLVVFFTDIFDPVTSANALHGLRRLARRHVVLCALMNDAAIATALADAPKTSAQAYRAGVAVALADERASVVAELRSFGVLVVDVPASRLTSALLDAYLDLKTRARI
jgi:uncharacterized protein (DUF58 family)